MSNSRPLVFAVTSHGYGHLSRSLELVRALQTRSESVEVVLSSRAAPWMLKRLVRPVSTRDASYEPGAAQKNCFEVDVPATRLAYDEFFASRDRRLDEERAFLRSVNAAGVVADIPALALRAAKDLGLPSVALGNFTWDWILESYGFEDHVERLRADYACADRWLRLPFGPEDGPFERIESAPLLGRVSTRAPEETRRFLGLDANRPVVLVCVGGWGSLGWQEINVKGCRELQLIVVDSLPLRTEAAVLRLPNELRPGLEFPDLVRASDLVLTKPGYGIASECVLARTPMLGIERRDFRESRFLTEGLDAAGPFGEIALEDFFKGHWKDPIRAVLDSERTWSPLDPDGTMQLAGRVEEIFRTCETRT